ncbi:MAG: hypothetical protein J6T08_06200 [Lentisphaeria bacterium]|nr:hypothetical protein [Lentisphaeria bacterium]
MFADRISLTMPETLLVAVAGILVVIAELALITVLILGISKILRSLESKLSGGSIEVTEVKATPVAPAAAPAPAAPAAAPVAYAPSVQLVDVDEPTAAVVMALVSNQTGIPLERLWFKSIKGKTELVDVDERTAATIMAIVSKESGIPLDRLSFKSIKKVEE